jgi:ferritin
MDDSSHTQANMEMQASLEYMSMSYWFDKRGMTGFRDHFREQSAEERGHSMEFLDYVNKRGGTARILSLVTPAVEFKSPSVAMTHYLDLERKVADSINDKYAKANDAKDWPTKV